MGKREYLLEGCDQFSEHYGSLFNKSKERYLNRLNKTQPSKEEAVTLGSKIDEMILMARDSVRNKFFKRDNAEEHCKVESFFEIPLAMGLPVLVAGGVAVGLAINGYPLSLMGSHLAEFITMGGLSSIAGIAFGGDLDQLYSRDIRDLTIDIGNRKMVRAMGKSAAIGDYINSLTPSPENIQYIDEVDNGLFISDEASPEMK